MGDTCITCTCIQNMARRGIKALPILPEGRYSKTPSWVQILEAFAPRTKEELYEKDRLIHVFIDPLTELQQTLLHCWKLTPLSTGSLTA